MNELELAIEIKKQLDVDSDLFKATGIPVEDYPEIKKLDFKKIQKHAEELGYHLDHEKDSPYKNPKQKVFKHEFVIAYYD